MRKKESRKNGGEFVERRKRERREAQRRRLLEEAEFRALIEQGKVFEGDRRVWEERRKVHRRRADRGEQGQESGHFLY